MPLFQIVNDVLGSVAQETFFARWVKGGNRITERNLASCNTKPVITSKKTEPTAALPPYGTTNTAITTSCNADAACVAPALTEREGAVRVWPS